MERLEVALGERAKVLRVSINSDLGRKLANHYLVQGIPQFIVFDARGNEISRGAGVPTLEKVLAVKQ